eukprot:scaffold4963_cov97-Isochrysis_galbana.AAC.7
MRLRLPVRPGLASGYRPAAAANAAACLRLAAFVGGGKKAHHSQFKAPHISAPSPSGLSMLCATHRCHHLYRSTAPPRGSTLRGSAARLLMGSPRPLHCAAERVGHLCLEAGEEARLEFRGQPATRLVVGAHCERQAGESRLHLAPSARWIQPQLDRHAEPLPRLSGPGHQLQQLAPAPWAVSKAARSPPAGRSAVGGLAARGPLPCRRASLRCNRHAMGVGVDCPHNVVHRQREHGIPLRRWERRAGHHAKQGLHRREGPCHQPRAGVATTASTQTPSRPAASQTPGQIAPPARRLARRTHSRRPQRRMGRAEPWPPPPPRRRRARGRNGEAEPPPTRLTLGDPQATRGGTRAQPHRPPLAHRDHRHWRPHPRSRRTAPGKRP